MDKYSSKCWKYQIRQLMWATTNIFSFACLTLKYNYWCSFCALSRFHRVMLWSKLAVDRDHWFLVRLLLIFFFLNYQQHGRCTNTVLDNPFSLRGVWGRFSHVPSLEVWVRIRVPHTVREKQMSPEGDGKPVSPPNSLWWHLYLDAPCNFEVDFSST